MHAVGALFTPLGGFASRASAAAADTTARVQRRQPTVETRQGEGRRAALEAITRHALAHGLASAQADTRRHLFLLALQLRGDRLDLIHCRPFVARRRSRLELRPFCV